MDSNLLQSATAPRGYGQFIGIRMQFKDGLKPIAYVQWEEKMPEDVCRGFDDDHVRWLGDAGWNAPTEGEKASISVGTVRLCLR